MNVYRHTISLLGKKFNVDARYFLSGGFWLGIGQCITILFGLLSALIFANFLNEYEYGTYKYLIGTAALFGGFSLTGLGQSVLQTTARGFYSFYRETIFINFLYSVPIFLTSIAASFYYYINENLVLSLGCLAIALIEPIARTFLTTQSFLQGAKEFNKSLQFHTFRVVFTTFASVFVLYFTGNILIVFIIYLISNALTNFLGFLYFRPPDNTPDTPLSQKRKYLKYAKNTSLRNLIQNCSQRLDTIVIFTQLGAVELATYSIAILLPEQIKGSFKNLSALLLPKYAKNSLSTTVSGIPKRSFQLGVLLAIITVLYLFMAPIVYGLLFPKYPDAIFLSQLSSLSFLTFILIIPFTILQSQLAERDLYELTFVGSILQIFLVLFLTVSFGILGTIISRIIHRILLTILAYIVLYNHIKKEKIITLAADESNNQ